jgi:Flp pilus assembly protein CpaB
VVQQGDHIAVYGMFSNVTLLRGSIADFLAGKVADSAGQRLPDFITTVVPEVQVLKVVQGVITATSQQSNVALTLALKPDDAARVVLAEQKGTLWIALLPPNQQGQTIPPSGLFDLIGAKGPLSR